MSDFGIQRPPSHIPLDVAIRSTPGDGVNVQSQQQAKMASAKLTPLPTPQPLSGPKADLIDSAVSKSTGKGVNTCPSRKEVAEKRLDEAADKCKEAQKVGVDVAKSTFFRKMLSVAANVVAVAVATGLTAISLGGAAPVLGIACASLANSIGDATCAYRNVKNAEAKADGREPPYDLPGGNSFMGNVGHAIATKLGASPETAEKVGKALGFVVGTGLAIAGIAVGAGLATAPMAAQIVSDTAKAITTVTGTYSAIASAMGSGIDKEHVKNLTLESASLVDRAKILSPDVDVSRVVSQLGNAEDVFKLASGDQDLKGSGMKGVGYVGGLVGGLVMK